MNAPIDPRLLPVLREDVPVGSTALVIQPHPFQSASIKAVTLEGVTLARIVESSGLAPEYLPYVRVWIDDTEIPRHLWGSVRPRAGRVVYVRIVPMKGGGGGKNPLASILMLAVAVAAMSYGVPLGDAILGQSLAAFEVGATTLGQIVGGAVIGMVGSLLVSALIPPPKPPQFSPVDFGQVSPSYQVTGTNNQSGLFKNIPRIYGRRRVYPMYAARAYTESAGNDQYVRLLLIVGFGPLRISELKIGETPIDAFAGVEYEITEGGPSGWAGNAPIKLYTQTIRETPLSVALTAAGSWQQRTTFAATSEISIDISFPQGLATFDSNGGRSARVVQFEAQYRAVGAGSWTNIAWTNSEDSGFGTPGAITVSDSSQPAVRRSGRFVFPSAGQYDIQIRRITAVGTTQQIDVSYWTVLRSVEYVEPVLRDDVCLIALRIKASEQLNGVPDSINCIAESWLPVWSGSAFSWQISRSPAWAALDVLRRRGSVSVIPDSRIDLTTFKAFADACAAAPPTGGGAYWTYDGVHEGGSIFAAHKTILSHGRATHSLRDGKYSLVRDIAQTVPSQHITPRNSWGYSGTKRFADLPHALKIRFINEDAGYQEDEVIVYADGYTESTATKFETMEFYGAARSSQVWREGRYHLAVGRLRPEEHVVSMDIENLRCSTGDLVMFQHDVISVGLLAGRVVDVILSGSNITGLRLDTPVEMIAGTNYGMRVRTSTGSSVVFSIVTVVTSGSYYTVSLNVALPSSTGIAAGDLFMFGLLNSESAPMLVRRIDPGLNLTANITMVDAQSGVWTADSGTIPAFNTNITNQAPLEQLAPEIPTFSLRSDESAITRLQDGTLQERIGVLFNAPVFSAVRIGGFEVQFKESGASGWGKIERVTVDVLELFLSPVTEGVLYQVRSRSVSFSGIPSEWSDPVLHTVVGKSSKPADPTGFSYQHRETGTRIFWNASTDIDFDVTEVRTGASFDAGTRVFRGIDKEFLSTFLPAGNTTFWVRHYDVAGNASLNAVSVVVPVTVPSAPTLTVSIDGGNYKAVWVPGSSTYPIAEYDVRHTAASPGGTAITKIKGTSFAAPVAWAGARTFFVAAIDAAGNIGAADSKTLTITVPSAPAITRQVVDNNVLLQWSDAQQTLPIKNYEFFKGNVFATATLVGTVGGRFAAIFEDAAGQYRYWVRGIDVAGNPGTESNIDAYVNQPPDYNLFSDSNLPLQTTNKSNVLRKSPNHFVLSLNGSTQYASVASIAALDSGITGLTFEAWIFWDPSQASHGIIEKTIGGTVNTSALLFVESGTLYARVCIGGSLFTVGTGLTAANQNAPIHAVLRWDSANGIQIATQGVNRATSAASGSLAQGAGALKLGQLGTGATGYSLKGKLGPCRIYSRRISDTELAEHYNNIYKNESGLVAAWAMVEGSGNVIKDATNNLNVATIFGAPSWERSALDGRYDLSETEAIYYPVYTNKTWAEWFTDNGWTTIQNAISAGYTNLLTPTPLTGQFVEVIDYGVTISATKITITVEDFAVIGAVTITPKISVKNAIGDAWTDFAGVYSVFTTQFRYVKVTLDFACVGGSHLKKATRVNVTLDVKLKNDSGMVNCAASDAGGTTVTFNVDFVDVNSITVTPSGTSPVIPVYDFTDVPNPTSFKVLLFDRATGNRVSGNASWAAKGA